MSLSLWIPAAWQYGELAPGEARQGAMRQAVAQAIQGHLLAAADPKAAGDAYDRILLEFTRTLWQFEAPTTRPAAQSLWAALFPAEQVEAVKALEADARQVPALFEAAFCFAVHGLCSELALHWVEALGAADEEEDEEKSSEAVAPWQAEYAKVLSAIASLLRPSVWSWLRDDTNGETSKAEDLRLVTAGLLDTLLAVLADWFAVETGETETRNGRPHTPKYIVLRQPALAQRIEALLADLPFRFTVQPLKEPVAYRLGDRGPEDCDDSDYFRVDLIGYRRSNDFLRRLHAGALKKEHRAPEFDRYIAAVNLQQAVPWRINRDLLHWARLLKDIAGSADVASGLDERALTEVREWAGNAFYRPVATGARKAIERPGEFLDSPLAYRVIDELCRTDANGAPATFYLPWKADYRGRIYAETPWLTPQGGDLQRALFEFANGRPLDGQGVDALRRHGANLAKRSRILGDLNIVGRQVVTLAERERWVIEHETQILASAASPLAEPFWREVAGKPMQFLAFCLAYRQWKLNPNAPVHLPVQIDGTCNGLQHIAALTGDAALARAVNVLPRDDGLPGDIYSELAEAAVGTLGRLPCSRADAVHRQGLDLADAWLAAAPERRAWLNRDIAKKVVMTIPYGASRGAQARDVLEKITEAFERQWQQHAPALDALDSLLAWKSQKKTRRIFVAKCTRGLFGEQRKRAFSGKDELVRALSHEDWECKRTLAAYVALAIVGHLRAALSSRYPSVDAFSQWLKQTADACAGLPLLWLSPLGVAVCQDKFRLEGSSVTARIGAKTIRVDVERLGEEVDAKKQRDALLPNLIHSLDATHLAMTSLDAQQRRVTDIGSIHDCLLCHPNDAATLGTAVRQTFVRLYRPDSAGVAEPLARWRNWMDVFARLKGLRQVEGVLGALDTPGGMAERLLAANAQRGQEEAGAALALLNELRTLPPSQCFLARSMLEFLCAQAVAAEGNSTVPLLPASRHLQLSAANDLSDYFFS